VEQRDKKEDKKDFRSIGILVSFYLKKIFHFFGEMPAIMRKRKSAVITCVHPCIR